jgi:hypothetical protein
MWHLAFPTTKDGELGSPKFESDGVVAPDEDWKKYNLNADPILETRRFVQMEIDRHVVDIGPPIQMLVIDKGRPIKMD